jgi:putative ABC transport system permease protein
MIVRNVTRARWKSLSTVAGIVMALGVLGALLSMFDAIDVVADLQFNHIYREDVAVYFDVPRGRETLHEIGHLPGVLALEPVRVSPARLIHGPRERRASLIGLMPGGQLRRIVDAEFRVHAPPVDGILISRGLADKLDVVPGETLRIEVTEGRRPVKDMIVAGLVDELMGADVYLEDATLYRLLGEGRTVSGAWLQVDENRAEDLYARLKRLPGVSTVIVKDAVVQGFEDTIEQSFVIALSSTLVLGAALVMAIVYNQARVALSERGRELASLRVLGFTRHEVARMLLGEQAMLVLAALPFGLVLGWLLTLAVMMRFETDVFRLPVVVEPTSYLLAVGIVLASAVAAALLVRRRLDRINLIAVLKTRE